VRAVCCSYAAKEAASNAPISRTPKRNDCVRKGSGLLIRASHQTKHLRCYVEPFPISHSRSSDPSEYATNSVTLHMCCTLLPWTSCTPALACHVLRRDGYNMLLTCHMLLQCRRMALLTWMCWTQALQITRSQSGARHSARPSIRAITAAEPRFKLPRRSGGC
jgi:hypothetical protein